MNHMKSITAKTLITIMTMKVGYFTKLTPFLLFRRAASRARRITVGATEGLLYGILMPVTELRTHAAEFSLSCLLFENSQNSHSLPLTWEPNGILLALWPHAWERTAWTLAPFALCTLCTLYTFPTLCTPFLLHFFALSSQLADRAFLSFFYLFLYLALADRAL